jgi:hypothetical protein
MSMVATHNEYTFGLDDGPAVIDFKVAELELLHAHPDALRRMLYHDADVPNRFFWISYWTRLEVMHSFGSSEELGKVRNGFLGRISTMTGAGRWDMRLVEESGGWDWQPGATLTQLVVRGSGNPGILARSLAPVGPWQLLVDEADPNRFLLLLSGWPELPPYGDITRCVIDLVDEG